MKNKVILVLLILVVGCATSPNIIVEEPWKRITEISEVNLSDQFALEVEGVDLVFPQNSKITSQNLKTLIDGFLSRRGIETSDDGTRFMIRVKFLTERHLFDNSQIFLQQNTAIGLQDNSDLYFSILGLFKQQYYVSQEAIMNDKFTELYVHQITMEISDENNDQLWRGETRWFDSNLDIVQSSFKALKYLLAELPKKESPQVKLKKIKKESYLSYFDYNLRSVNFVCPALPYYITFRSSLGNIPAVISNPEYMSGYNDMLKFSEEAIPVGKDYDNLLSSSLWNKAWLLSEYEFDGDKVTLLIRLTGTPSGYRITECKKATLEEKEYYISKASEYEEAMRQFFNFYE